MILHWRASKRENDLKTGSEHLMKAARLVRQAASIKNSDERADMLRQAEQLLRNGMRRCEFFGLQEL